ncbi:hypothetical protein JXR93_11855 [bacterium]|nr:hypothetical protein [bacterium]
MVNSSAILFPYIRALISLVTYQTDSNKILLPIFNFSNILNNLDENEIFLSSKDFIEFSVN